MAAQIIQFPVQHSNGYNNLIQLFEICDSLESCNFYLETVEQLFQKGYISEKGDVHSSQDWQRKTPGADTARKAGVAGGNRTWGVSVYAGDGRRKA